MAKTQLEISGGTAGLEKAYRKAAALENKAITTAKRANEKMKGQARSQGAAFKKANEDSFGHSAIAKLGSYATAAAAIGLVMKGISGTMETLKKNAEAAAAVAREHLGDPFRQLMSRVPAAERPGLLARTEALGSKHGMPAEQVQRAQLALESGLIEAPGKRARVAALLKGVLEIAETTGSGQADLGAQHAARLAESGDLSNDEIINLVEYSMKRGGTQAALKSMEFGEAAGLGPAEQMGLSRWLTTQVSARRVPSIQKALLDITQAPTRRGRPRRIARRVGITEGMDIMEAMERYQQLTPAEQREVAPELADYAGLIKAWGGEGFTGAIAGARTAMEAGPGQPQKTTAEILEAEPALALQKKKESNEQEIKNSIRRREQLASAYQTALRARIQKNVTGVYRPGAAAAEWIAEAALAVDPVGLGKLAGVTPGELGLQTQEELDALTSPAPAGHFDMEERFIEEALEGAVRRGIQDGRRTLAPETQPGDLPRRQVSR